MLKEELNQLIKRAMEGDEKAFERVVEQKVRKIIYVSAKLMNNSHDAEDAAQEILIQMYKHIRELKDPEAFNTWMYQIITRTCINQKKRRRRNEHERLEVLEDEERVAKEMRREYLPQEYIEDVDKRDFLMKVIDELPEHYKLCLLLFFYEDLSYHDIAQVMNMSEKTVANTLLRAKKKIRLRLETKYASKGQLQPYMAVVPVLTQVFQLEETTLVVPEVVARILAGAGIGVTSGLAGSAGGMTTAAGGGTSTVAAGSSSTGSIAAGGLSTSSKVLAGMVAATTAMGVATHVMVPGLAWDGETPDGLANQEEPAILTLEDMIGPEQAELLREYERGLGDWNEWSGFLQELSALSVYTGEDEHTAYVLYHLEKQDKQLLILEKSTAGVDPEVAFLFTDSHVARPRELELIEAMERWRQ